MNKNYSQANYIDWNFDATTISPLEFNKILDTRGVDTLIPTKDGYRPNTNLAAYKKNCMCIAKKNNSILFFMVDRRKVKVKLPNNTVLKTIKFVPEIYRVAANNYNPTIEHMNPGMIFNKFITKFREHYGRTFNSVYPKAPTNFRPCIPSPLNYGLRDVYPYLHVYKADISSAYGYELSKEIPTADGYLEFDEYREPNSEFKFAFYPNDQALAIHGEGINTLSSLNKSNVKKTYLMKASKYPLTPIINTIYEQKEAAETKTDRQVYKDLLNIPVGYFQRKANPMYAYITAVVIARCNKRVSDWRDRIEAAGNTVILINTDAIAWDGRPMPDLYTSKKALGNFILEHEQARAFVKGAKCYQIMDNGKLTTIYAGLPVKYQEELKFGDIMNMDYEMEGYTWNDDTLRYESITLNEFYRERSK